ncbi:CobW family GTP-binding protein [Paraburkholderia hospita]|uniref:CobW family GTP-binding protein n=1 Tax=Paraburkholderia hospita TaxID=169430 RepID=UPI0008A7D922|nr:GTP-binding protein [Paraburkholderia hospita]SEI20755.1 GTPase, G3E family [Paraburkholderia hospita]
MSLIPTTILTGFLGAGKTTLLKRILTEEHHQRIAVIENEIGEEDVDSEILVTNGQEQIIQLSNGCICCTIRDDLRSTLHDLIRRRVKGDLEFERVVIETTGLADPAPVAQTFFLDSELSEQYLLDSVVVLVDARHGPDSLDNHLVARQQVGFADRIFITKTDLASDSEIAALTHRLLHINARAPIKTVQFGEVALSEVFDLRGFNLDATLDFYPEFFDASDERHSFETECHEAHCDHSTHQQRHRDDVSSFVFRSQRAFDREKLGELLAAFLNNYGSRLLRCKGILDIHGSNRKVIFQGVHQLMETDFGPSWGEDEKRKSKMIFIGIDLPQDHLVRGLERCLI